MNYIGEITELYHAFFHQEFRLDHEAYQFLIENNSLTLLESFYKHLNVSDFQVEAIEEAIKQSGIDTQTKGKPLFMGLRIATTGDMHGPSLPASLALLGKEEVIKRLTYTIDKLRGES